MVRWKYCLVLAMLLLLRTDAKGAEDEDDEDCHRGEENEEEEDDEEDEEEDDRSDSMDIPSSGRRMNVAVTPPTAATPSRIEYEEEEDQPDSNGTGINIPSGRRMIVAVTPLTSATPSRNSKWSTSTTKKAPLECYVCGYRSEMPLRSCLDPTKYRVHSVTCHNLEDKCFTTVISKDKSYVAVIRGCRTGCVGSPDTTCCERNRCNNQAFAMPIVPRAQEFAGASIASIATKTTPSNVLFFVTVLLLLQTVVKVAFV